MSRGGKQPHTHIRVQSYILECGHRRWRSRDYPLFPNEYVDCVDCVKLLKSLGLYYAIPWDHVRLTF